MFLKIFFYFFPKILNLKHFFIATAKQHASRAVTRTTIKSESVTIGVLDVLADPCLNILSAVFSTLFNVEYVFALLYTFNFLSLAF